MKVMLTPILSGKRPLNAAMPAINVSDPWIGTAWRRDGARDSARPEAKRLD